ncbi:MAG: amino acid permease [Planctomycetaceae bacterium]|nr:amino acid permease [Planctomycetaceae bacterium]
MTTSTDAPDSVNTYSQRGLVRVLGPGMAMAMVVGNVIGNGIFSKPGEAAAAAGNVSLVTWAWIAGGLVSLIGGLCFAELAVAYPRAGGIYVYLKEAYGRSIAFLFAWSEFVFGRPASIGVCCIILMAQVKAIFKTDIMMWEEIGLSLIAIAIIATLNIRGVIWGGRVQGFTTLLKCLMLILLAALPFVLTGRGEIGFDTDNFASTMKVDNPSLAVRFAGALLAVSWAYNGWHAVCPIAEEIRNPSRNILIAMMGGLMIIFLVYGLLNLAYHGSMTLDEISQANYMLPQVMIEKLLNPVSTKLAQFGSLVISISISLSMIGGINVNLMNGPRVALATGRDEPALERLGVTSERFHTPKFSIIFQAVMSGVTLAVVALYLELTQQPGSLNIFFTLTNYVVYSASIFFMLTVGAVIVLRKTAADRERPFKTPLYPFLPIAYLIFNAWFLYAVFIGQPVHAMVSIALSLIGWPIWWMLQPRDRHNS